MFEPATLRDIYETYRLNAICNDCGRCRELEVAGLMDRYGDNFEVPRLTKMVKCSECGSEHGCAVQLGLLDSDNEI